MMRLWIGNFKGKTKIGYNHRILLNIDMQISKVGTILLNFKTMLVDSMEMQVKQTLQEKVKLQTEIYR